MAESPKPSTRDPGMNIPAEITVPERNLRIRCSRGGFVGDGGNISAFSKEEARKEAARWKKIYTDEEFTPEPITEPTK